MNTKWQRIRYMPATPLGSDGRRVTGSSEHINLSRQAATEGMVLLKNSNGLLPLPLGKRIAVFGKAQVDYVKGGGGSGDVTVAYVRTLLDGLSIKQEEGKIELFDPLSHFYSEDVQKQFRAGCAPGKTTEPALPEALLTQARSFTDTALITLCRYSCEGSDRTGIPGDGDFYLSKQEELMVSQVEALFPHIIVVLNTGGIMDTSWFRDSDRIGAALLGWQAGMEGGLATADILVGDVCPSGHLTDTFAEAFADYPSSATFAESEDYVTYDEDIYVGYRFFETIPGAAQKVCYPFGYGLSYTSFALSNLTGGKMESGDVQVTCRVTNTGHVAGKQVIQLYGEAPQGKLGKPSRVLCAFAKTKLLAPGGFEDILLSVNPYLLASYDDEDLVARSAYVLEAGDYHFYLGDNVRDVEIVSYTMTIDKDKIVRQLSPRCVPHNLHRRLRADGTYTPVQADGRAADNGVDHAVVPSGHPVITRSIPKEPQAGTLLDVAENRLTLDMLVDSLNDEQLVHLLGGQPNRGVADTCGFGNLPECSVPNAMTADGPAGLRTQQLERVNANTVIHYHAIIHRALKYAVKMDMIPYNPADKIERPKKERFVGSFYDSAEINALFQAVKGHTLEPPIKLAAFYGLRRSEVLGLKWNAIDFDANTITIRHTVTACNLDGKHIEVVTDSTKTKSSMRTLPLVPEFRELLLHKKEQQEHYRRLCGRSYCTDYLDYICVNEIGERLKPNTLSNGFKRILEQNNLRIIRLHDLRHTCASLLLANGVPMKQIQEWLGHSDFSTTANIYAHLDYHSKLSSAEAMLTGLELARPNPENG